MTTPYFFGYGSLVNRATHAYGQAHPARITGWRRRWRHVAGRKVAFLTVVEHPGTTIEGLIAGVPGADWNALDAREHSYLRVPANTVEHALAPDTDVQLYHAPEHLHAPATTQHPILLSYIDVVVQGYLREFGEKGVAGFFQTTDGWDAPILDDREDPIYPRHQPLSAGERALADRHLQTVGAEVFNAKDSAMAEGARFVP